MSVVEKFELSGGVTILACKGCNSNIDVVGKRFYPVSGDKIRQPLTIVCERKMLNKQSKLDQRVFEAKDVVELSREEARSGAWQLVLE
ncbi:hypothetical protein [Pseudomonas sp. NFACC13-1]|uniref:hypothetical protein n=1 Tax=Pseudomonas sp. NFACC13-1 TaxID=1566245 RepID=UPI0015A23301|nr:hypothetical protein [Pseudomonas sp. NFACC13-1]